jgi:uncharacterized protein (TIGR02246 family)
VSASDEADVRSIYQRLIDAWNRRDAAAYAALFDDVTNVVGFDGSQMNGRSEIESTLAGIFAHHQTAPYLSIVREVRMLTAEVAILRAVAGMVPPGQTDINPAVNAIQSLVAVKRDGQWRIALFQNTPAQFHGRPELAQQLTEELRQLLRR